MCLVATVFSSTALDINQNLHKWSRKEIFHGYILVNTDKHYFGYEVRQRPTNSAFLMPFIYGEIMSQCEVNSFFQLK